MRPIADIEITNIEKLLLPHNNCFSENGSFERIDVIKEMENSCDVVACPGSGKTTVLLAKLLLLADRLPFEDNRGICVLTHTNVAIEEIKKKARVKADILFKYPNFFGTFQGFVDKYLAIPMFKSITKQKPYVIDNEYYYNIINKRFTQYGYLSGHSNDTIRKVKHYFNVYQNLHSLRFKYDNNQIKLCKDVNGTNFIVRKPKSRNDWSASEKELIYEYLKAFKLEILKRERVLCFDDAYFLADFYVKINPTQIKNLLSKRFKYVFVDEMQDTDLHQQKIIDNLFERTDTIVQYFGDPNQAIYDFSTKEELVWKLDTGQRYNISDSKRYGNPISDALNKVKVETTISLTGATNVNSLQPTLFVFKEGEQTKVLEEFVKLISTNQSLWLNDYISKGKTPTYKAVGWVAKEREAGQEDKLNIKSYWNDYDRNITNTKYGYSNLISYLVLGSKSNGVINTPKAFENFINSILHLLSIESIKTVQRNSFTRNSLLKFCKEKGKYIEFREKLAGWFMKLHQQDQSTFISQIFPQIQSYIKQLVQLTGHTRFSTEANNFIDQTTPDIEANKSSKYKLDGFQDIEVEVGTVHSVKGETHAATLYLETFLNRKYEIERIKDILTGNKNLVDYETEINQLEQEIQSLAGGRGTISRETKLKTLKNQQTEIMKALKMVHVGFSRPTHLLCFAICETRISDAEIDLLNIETDSSNHWKIKRISTTSA